MHVGFICKHPYIEGIIAGLLCWSIFILYLFQGKAGTEREAAAAISAAFFFGFIGSGALSAFFYKRKRNRSFLFPPREALNS